MTAKLIPSENYLNDRKYIMQGIVEYALESGEDASLILRFFRNEEKGLQSRIKKSPLSAGIDFPHPVKKGTSHSGQYVIIYSFIPLNAQENKQVEVVLLNSIIHTRSNILNDLYRGLESADLDD